MQQFASNCSAFASPAEDILEAAKKHQSYERFIPHVSTGLQGMDPIYMLSIWVDSLVTVLSVSLILRLISNHLKNGSMRITNYFHLHSVLSLDPHYPLSLVMEMLPKSPRSRGVHSLDL